MTRVSTCFKVAVVGVAALGAGNAYGDSYYFYGDNATNYLTSPGAYAGTSNVGTSETYGDADGSVRSVIAAGWNTFDSGVTYVAEDLIENTRGADDLGLGIRDGSDTDDSSQPLELAKNEVIRLDLGALASGDSRSDIIVHFSSNTSGEAMKFGHSSSSSLTTGFTTSLTSTLTSTAGTAGNAVNLSTLFGTTIGRYLFFMEDPGSGGSNDDNLLMQIHYTFVDGPDPFPVPLPAAAWMGLTLMSAIGVVAKRRQIIERSAA